MSLYDIEASLASSIATSSSSNPVLYDGTEINFSGSQGYQGGLTNTPNVSTTADATAATSKGGPATASTNTPIQSPGSGITNPTTAGLTQPVLNPLTPSTSGITSLFSNPLVLIVLVGIGLLLFHKK